MPFHQRFIVPERLPARSNEIDGPFESFSDITNQTCSNIIRQLSSLASFAEEILGDVGNALANQNARIYNLSNRIEQLDAKVQILNPKQIARNLNQSCASPSSSVYHSPKHVDKRLFMQHNRPQSVVRLQSGLLRSDSQVPYRVGRSNSVSSSRPSRPRSLESDILLLSSNIPTNENGPIINSDRLRQAAGNGATTTERDRSVSLQNEISSNQSSGFEMSGKIAAIAPEKYLKRSTTVGTCQAISQPYHPTNQRPGSSQTVHRQLLAEFNQRNNESESSTSPERNNREQHHDLHGFADSRLALVRRSMIARRTQARLREKRRRNRTVALSPEDDRRSSFISTFLDTKQLQDQSCQVPSQHSTLSNKTNESGEESRVPPTKVLNSAQGCNSILPREFELISKQMEPQDTSSGCWSGGSTIQGGAVSGYDVPTCVTPTLLIQELNDQNLLRHNQLTSSSTFSDRMSSTDSSSTRNRAKPPPPQRSLDRPSQLKLITRLASAVSINDSQPTASTNQSPVFSNSGNHVLEVREFGYPAPIVLTPSEASESGLGSQNGEFQFPSPPKPNPRSRDASHDRNSTNQNQPDLESLLSSPARSSSSRSDFSSIHSNNELTAKLARRLTKIERIENGEERAFEKDDLDSSFSSTNQTSVEHQIPSNHGRECKSENIPLTNGEVIPATNQNGGSSRANERTEKMSFSLLPKTTNQNDAEIFKLPMVSPKNLEIESRDLLTNVEMPSVEVIWDNDASYLEDSLYLKNPIPEPITPIKTPTQLVLTSDDDVFDSRSNKSLDSPLSSPSRRPTNQNTEPMSRTLSLTERGRPTEKRSATLGTKRFGKTNSAKDFKSLLLRQMGSSDKAARSSAAERLKVAPGMTLQDLYRPKSTDSSPSRTSKNNEIDSSPRKTRNKSKNRFNSMHRLTSIVEEKDLIAAKELNNLLDAQQKNIVQNNADSLKNFSASEGSAKEKDSVELHSVPIS